MNEADPDELRVEDAVNRLVSPVERMFVDDPPSQEIANRLNAAYAATCEHGRNPCYLRCGVRTPWSLHQWAPIPKQERLYWLHNENITTSERWSELSESNR